MTKFELLQLLTTIIGAIISGLIPVIFPIHPSSKIKKIIRIIVFALIGGTIVYIIGFYVGSNTMDESGKTIQKSPIVQESTISPTVALTPTQIPIGKVLLEINFSQYGEGECNSYDENRLGYENKKYYINPTVNGFVAVCQASKDMKNQNAIQVVAYPETYSKSFGYGLFYGWEGTRTYTTNACVMGIQNNNEQTEAVFVDWVNGDYRKTTEIIKNFKLNEKPHLLRIIFSPDNLAQEYIDGMFIAEHRFTNCGHGPIGMVAWGEGQKLYFDNLTLFGDKN